jgi:uncharacterized radical SAM protein YgiQ
MISDKPPEKGKQFDVIIVTGDFYADHPMCGAAVIARVLDHAGYSVGIIEAPDWRKDSDFTKLGKPRLFFGVTSGAMDSMLDNYTPLLKKRAEDKYRRYASQKPDRAVLVYTAMIRKNFRGVPVVLGGVEASLRRFAHFDYWSNSMRRSMLLDSRADILAYGNAEYQTLEIAKRLEKNLPLDGIDGTCVVRNVAPDGFRILPTFEEMEKDSEKFCKMQMALTNESGLAQKSGDKFIIQYRAHRYTTEELDRVFELPYSRDIPEKTGYLKGMQFSVVTHRGCIGNCSFCSIALHQGTRIVSRSEKSLLGEIGKISKHKDFKGYVHDLGGPSANMYGMDCINSPTCTGNCISCGRLDKSHKKLLALMENARAVKGVKKVFVSSGIRYDIAADCPEYITAISKNHVSGYLKIAPEHCNAHVLKLMNKYFPGKLERFVSIFQRENKGGSQCIKYYVMTAHPGSSGKENADLAGFVRKTGGNSLVQVFTPTPMSMSTCMYCTGMDPHTGEKLYVPRSFSEKKRQKTEVMHACFEGAKAGRKFIGT